MRPRKANPRPRSRTISAIAQGIPSGEAPGARHPAHRSPGHCGRAGARRRRVAVACAVAVAAAIGGLGRLSGGSRRNRGGRRRGLGRFGRLRRGGRCCNRGRGVRRQRGPVPGGGRRESRSRCPPGSAVSVAPGPGVFTGVLSGGVVGGAGVFTGVSVDGGAVGARRAGGRNRRIHRGRGRRRNSAGRQHGRAGRAARGWPSAALRWPWPWRGGGGVSVAAGSRRATGLNLVAVERHGACAGVEAAVGHGPGVERDRGQGQDIAAEVGRRAQGGRTADLPEDAAGLRAIDQQRRWRCWP